MFKSAPTFNLSSIETVKNGFDEFLENFTEEGSTTSQYAVLATELVKFGETTLDVTIANIFAHIKSLNLVKSKLDPEDAQEKRLVRMV
jgi:hypothetical protein